MNRLSCHIFRFVQAIFKKGIILERALFTQHQDGKHNFAGIIYMHVNRFIDILKIGRLQTLVLLCQKEFLKESGGKTTCVIGLWCHWPVWHPWWMQECTVF